MNNPIDSISSTPIDTLLQMRNTDASLKPEEYFIGLLTVLVTYLFVILLFALTFCWLDNPNKNSYSRVQRSMMESSALEEDFISTR